jgi:nucleoside-diphosphate-sugar epimerase
MTSQTPVLPAIRDKKLFCFGYGYTASFLAEVLSPYGWRIAGTTTDPEKLDHLRAQGIDAHLFNARRPLADPAAAFDGVTHFLFSIPPDENGDPAFRLHLDDIADALTTEWAGYLSTTGVYGNHNGQWIDENTPPAPDSRRGSLRLKAEEQWVSMHLPLHIFRLSGIYGPGRSALDSVLSGTAQRINKPDHVFNRIHIEDIVQVLVASINQPSPGEIYNLADDMPAASSEVITYACHLANVEPPPLTPYEQAELSPMLRSFYKDNKRVMNEKVRNRLGVELLYPDYRTGLQACMDIMNAEKDTA